MRLGRQIALVTIAKFGVAGLNVCFVYLCMVRLGASKVADFFVQYSAIMLLSAFCNLGSGVAAFSIVSPARNRGDEISRDYSTLMFLGLIGIAVAGFLYSGSVALNLWQPINAVGTGFFLVGAGITLLMADLNRSAGDIALSILLQGAGPMLVLLAMMLILDVRDSYNLMTCAGVAYAVSAVSMIAAGFRNLALVSPAEVFSKAKLALKAAIFPAVSNMQVHAEIVLGSLFFGPSSLAVFVVANRMATLVKMPVLIVFRVFAPSMDARLAERLSFESRDRSLSWRLFLAGSLLLVAGLIALPLVEYLRILALPQGFYAMFAVCAGVKLSGLLLGSPESLLVAQGRFMATYLSSFVTLLAIAAICLATQRFVTQNEIVIVALISSWFVLQRWVMLWSTR